MKFLKTLLLLPVLFAGLAAPSLAQQPTIAVMNEERVLRESSAGQHIQSRMQEIAQEIDAELTASMDLGGKPKLTVKRSWTF